jgi:hypothetical protein
MKTNSSCMRVFGMLCLGKPRGDWVVDRITKLGGEGGGGFDL